MKRIDKITVVILAKNEESTLPRTLSHLADFSDVVIVDSHSTDATVQIAGAHGARVIQFTWDGRYPKKKQWALENCSTENDWILLLDADEYPTPELIEELRLIEKRIARIGTAAFDARLSYSFSGRRLQHGHVVTKRSLLNRNLARFPEVGDLGAPGIREVEGHYQAEVDGPIATLRGRIVHEDRDPVSSWFDRHNRYSDWEAHLRVNAELRSAIAEKRTGKGRLFDKVPLKPLAFFVYSYVARLGFLDGRAGFDYAFALSAYYWQIDVKHRELRRVTQEAPLP